jgi:prevent-host-death family protein
MNGTRKRGGRKRQTGKAGHEQISAAAFKATCLQLMDSVRETGVEYVITKHGTPVARLVPYASSERQSLFGSMKGTVLGYDRPFDPVDGVYDIERD